MSERTTIGGTVYEAIGSSSSNLLLKCNGTARIQWGSKLIDLIKNGKIASEDSQELIFIIKDESEMKSDGIYILTTDESPKLWIYKDRTKYDFNSADLYISAINPQNLTVEQKSQALHNIGVNYSTLLELEQSHLQNGIAYVLENQTLYTIKNGVIQEFEAKIKTVTVNTEQSNEGNINSTTQVVLSVLDEDYLILADKRITANYSIYVKDSAQIGSESADKTQGYRLYIDGGISYLDVDKVNVRQGLNISQYTEVTFEELNSLINQELLKSQEWYLITDFQNHWKLVVNDSKFNRPILVRALNEKLLYKKGYLFKDHRVQIQYDPTYQEIITQAQEIDGNIIYNDITTRGRITWMQDEFNNSANFDFLDYTDASGNALTTLHQTEENSYNEKDLSIFPKNSHDNTLITYDLKGTIIKDKVINNDNTTVVDFQIDDSEENSIIMHNNIIECRNLIVTQECSQFYNNTLKHVINLTISNDFIKSEFSSAYSKSDLTINDYEVTPFSKLSDNSVYNELQFTKKLKEVKFKEFIHSTISNELTNCSFGSVIETNIDQQIQNSVFTDIKSCNLYSSFNRVNFKLLSGCYFNSGNVEDVVSFSDLYNITFDTTSHNLLYNPSKRKEIYFYNEDLKILCIPDQIFYRGMIIMHSGIEEIPQGWAPCDGRIYEWNGISTQTPDLTGRFIRASKNGEVGASVTNTDLNAEGKLVLTTAHLPEHQHPHDSHTHDINNLSVSIDSAYVSVSSNDTYANGHSTKNVKLDEDGVPVSYIGSYNSGNWSAVQSSEDYGHTHGVTVSGGGTTNTYSQELPWLYGETQPINIEPDHYSLIFIMKL